MKKPISEMTVEECNDELVFRRFKSLLEKARSMEFIATVTKLVTT